MALARYQREKETTLGEGDCAFNAFTLALCTPDVFSELELIARLEREDINIRYQDFIMRVAEKLDVDVSWDVVKKELLRLRKEDKQHLQNEIAPIMRQLSIDIARNSSDAILLKAQTVEKLVSVYNDYARKENGKQVTAHDDVYSRHSFITNKFYEVYYGKEKDKLLCRKKIENWWWNEGYYQFLDAMERPGAWAGDIELARLARYFNVVLDVVPDEGFRYNIYGDYGYFPFLNDVVGNHIPKEDRNHVMECLRNHYVISSSYEHVHGQGVDFLITNFTDLRRRLSAVPDNKVVTEFIQDQAQLKEVLVPDKWSKRCLEELIQRDVIGRTLDGKNYRFIIDKDVALARIAEVPHLHKIMKICQQYLKTHPTLILHKSRDHWSNTLKIVTQEEQERVQQEFMRNLLSRGIFANPQDMLRNMSVAGVALRLSSEGLVRKKN